MTDAESTCYAAEPVNVLDVDARETSFLPDADSDVLVIIIICCIIGWALRLLFLAYSLREFALAKATGRLSVHSDVPLHSYIVPLDINARLRFLGYLRARTPAAPTAEVVAYTNPVELRMVCLTLGSESAGNSGEGEDVASTPHLSISFDCMRPATLQVFWGVAPLAGQRLERSLGASASSGSTGGRGDRSSSPAGRAVASGARPSASRPERSTLSSASSGYSSGGGGLWRPRPRGTLPQLNDISSPPPSAIEMAPLPPVRTNRGFSGRSAGADRGAAGGGGASAPSAPSAARDGGAPSHILSSSLYMYASDAVAVSAGRGHIIKLGPEALPTHADLEATLRSPCLLVFSGFGNSEPPPSSADLPQPVALRSIGAHMAAASEVASAAASGAAREVACEADEGPADEARPASPDAAALTAVAAATPITPSDTPPEQASSRASSRSLQGMGAGMGLMPALCVAATIGFGSTPAAGASESDATIAVTIAPTAPTCVTSTTLSSAVASGASPCMGDASAVASSTATLESLFAPFSPRSPRTPPSTPLAGPVSIDGRTDPFPTPLPSLSVAAPQDASARDSATSAAAGSAATESAPISAVSSSGSYVGTGSAVSGSGSYVGTGSAVSGRGSYVGTVEQLLLGTADGFLEVAEVFGFQSVGDGEDQRLCVACMAEPKDTIVLPCRHLCVCSSCFDQLTNERCPVCRTLFTSFLRIDPSLNSFSKSWGAL